MELEQALNAKEEFWRQKSRLNWHCDGERNTIFFHRTTKIRYTYKSITVLKYGETIIDDPEDISQHVLNLYSSLYDTTNDYIANDLISKVVPSSITPAVMSLNQAAFK